MSKDPSAAEIERQKEKILARWEGEGGALGGSAPKTTPVLGAADLRILSRLGAALLDQWDSLPAECRALLYQCASKLHAETDGARIKAKIAGFLDEHKAL